MFKTRIKSSYINPAQAIDPMRLLYICTHNRCRSILAEAVTRHLAAERIIAASAGSTPVGTVHPLSLKYLAEFDINTDKLSSESWDIYADFEPDAVILLCNSAANESCPTWLNSAAVVHWTMPDPSIENTDEEKTSAAFRHTIEALQKKINSLLAVPFEQLSKQQRIEQLTRLAG